MSRVANVDLNRDGNDRREVDLQFDLHSTKIQLGVSYFHGALCGMGRLRMKLGCGRDMRQRQRARGGRLSA